MKLQTRYRIDSIVGRPLVAVLNLMAYCLGKIMRRDHALDTTRTIVICKMMGLGSLVQITPLITSLRRGFPEARIIFLTRIQNREYCALIEEIDAILTVDDRSIVRLSRTAARVLVAMWKARVDLFINLEVYANLSALLAVTSCARNRLGYYLVARDQRAWGIYTHIVYFNRAAPIHEVYLQAARCLGIDVLGGALLKPRIDAGSESAFHARLRHLGIEPRSYLVINPNSSELSAERRWPAKYFADTIVQIHGQFPELCFLLIGGHGEEQTAADVIRCLPTVSDIRLNDFTGALTIVELVILLRDARALLTNDSGPMHLALSLSVPTVAMFGPVSPRHYGGIESASRILLYRNLYCSPCIHHFIEAPCGGDNQCMKLIQPAEAAEAINSLLSGKALPESPPSLRYFDKGRAFGTHRRNSAVDAP